MHLEITRTQRQFMALFQTQRNYLAAKPTPYLKELLNETRKHAAEEAFSVRAAAAINEAAATLILEGRA